MGRVFFTNQLVIQMSFTFHAVQLQLLLFIFQKTTLFVLGAYLLHYDDVIMSAMASQITSVPKVCTTVCTGSDQSKHQSSASLAFVRGIHR